jgi:phosphate-selective porin OprO/OprP
VLQTPEYSLHVGGDVGGLLKAPGSPAAVTLADRPELRVDPTTIIGTGALGTAANPVTGAMVYGVEAAAGWRNLFLQGEYYHVDLDRRGLASNAFDGGYIEGSWIISGEQRKYNPVAGAYGGVVPEHPFEPWAENFGTGAWELAGRYSTINLNDRVSGPSAVAGGFQNVYAVGVNWYPNANIRFLFDFLHGDVSKRFATGAPSGGGIAGTPGGTPVGGSFDALAMRMQFAF